MRPLAAVRGPLRLHHNTSRCACRGCAACMDLASRNLADARVAVFPHSDHSGHFHPPAGALGFAALHASLDIGRTHEPGGEVSLKEKSKKSQCNGHARVLQSLLRVHVGYRRESSCANDRVEVRLIPSIDPG